MDIVHVDIVEIRNLNDGARVSFFFSGVLAAH